jgi:hypothetical protein
LYQRVWIGFNRFTPFRKLKGGRTATNELISVTITKMPRTGRIGRFVKIIEKELGEEALLRVLQDSENYKSFKPPQQAAWWKSAIERLEEEVGTTKAIEIMSFCGQKCCGTGTRKSAKRLMDESKSMEEFLRKASTYGVTEGDVEYKLKDDKTIIGTFRRCFCKQVAQTEESFKNMTYCQCSVEFHKQYFEAALGKPITVELKQSIISGAENCVFTLHIDTS